MQRLRRYAASPSGMVEAEDLAIGVLPQLPGEAIGKLRLVPKPKPKPKRKPITLHNDWSVSLGSGTPGTDAWYPAKWTFNPPVLSLAYDFVVFPTDVAGVPPGVSGQANIIGFYYMYGSGLPWFFFSHYVGPGIVQTSPTLSKDGTKVAYVESSGASVFHVLKIGTSGNTGDGPIPTPPYASASKPVYPGTVTLNGSTTTYGGNNAVDVGITMSGGVSVTRSSPFVDYTNDVAYVGDDSGYLHKFTEVFTGTPAECTSTNTAPPCESGWPLTVTGTATTLTGPVYDATSGNIFLGSSNGTLYCVRETGSSVDCGCSSPPCLGSNTVTSSGGSSVIFDAPLVDSTAGMVYATINDSSNSNVLQVSTDLISTKVTATFGAPAQTELYDGDFDNSFYTTDSGYLYFCGNSTVATTLYRIAISSGVMSGSNDGNTLAVTNGTANSDCSPLSEFYNTGYVPTKDLLLLALPSFGYVNTPSLLCNSVPCVENFSLGSSFPPILNGFTIGSLSTTTLSAIIIDSGNGGSYYSNIYFADIGGHTAYQLSQAAL